MPTRKQIFTESPRTRHLRRPAAAGGRDGVYFSERRGTTIPGIRRGYRGVLLMLLQNHVQFRIVTARTLDAFRGKVWCCRMCVC